jgi:plastocyanin
MKRWVTIGLAFVLVFSVACSNEKKVGQGIDVEKLSDKSKALGEIDEKKSGGGGFVGEKEEEDAEKKAAEQAAAAAAAAAAAEAAEEQQKEAAVKFDITPTGYSTPRVRVFVGGTIAVTNKDTVPRAVTARNGDFTSGDIAPGETWPYTPPKAGTWEFYDSSCVKTRSGTCGVRNSVQGTLEVLPR